MENNEIVEKSDNPIVNMEDSIVRLEEKLNFISDYLQKSKDLSAHKFSNVELDNRLIVAYSQTYGLFADCFMQAGFGNESIPFSLSCAYQKKLEKLFELQMKKTKRLYRKQLREDRRREKVLSRKQKKSA